METIGIESLDLSLKYRYVNRLIAIDPILLILTYGVSNRNFYFQSDVFWFSM